MLYNLKEGQIVVSQNYSISEITQQTGFKFNIESSASLFRKKEHPLSDRASMLEKKASEGI